MTAVSVTKEGSVPSTFSSLRSAFWRGVMPKWTTLFIYILQFIFN